MQWGFCRKSKFFGDAACRAGSVGAAGLEGAGEGAVFGGDLVLKVGAFTVPLANLQGG